MQRSLRVELPIHCDIYAPESGPPSLPSLDDLPTLRLMLGLPDRESSPEEVDVDGNNGLERLFWITPRGQSLVSPTPPEPRHSGARYPSRATMLF